MSHENEQIHWLQHLVEHDFKSLGIDSFYEFHKLCALRGAPVPKRFRYDAKFLHGRAERLLKQFSPEENRDLLGQRVQTRIL